MTSPIRLMIFSALVLAGFCTLSFAQDPANKASRRPEPSAKNATQGEKAKRKSPAKPPRRNQPKAQTQKPAPDINKARRAEIMSFVKQHHPEIRPLLNTLRKNRPEQFASTLRTLDREVRSIQALESRAPERYKKVLAMWIARSKIRLLSAQLAVKTSDSEKRKLRKQIHSLIERHWNLRTQQLTSDIQLAEQRVERLNSQLSTLNTNRENDIKRQMDSITRNAKRISENQKKKRNANGKKAGPKKQNLPNPNQRDKDKELKDYP